MLSSTCEILQCPCCHSQFRIGTTWKKQGKELIFASFVCACDEFPIVEGILFLFKPLNRRILDLLREKNFYAATMLCLSQKRKFNTQSWWMKAFGNSIAKRVIDPRFLSLLGKEKLMKLLPLVIPKHLVTYYFTRDQWQDALLSAFPIASLLSQRAAKKRAAQEVIWLDIGSGIVNSFSELKKNLPALRTLSLDSNFANLYLSRVFYPAKDVSRICADGHFCQVVRPGKLDIVTLIDTLQSLQAPVPAIKQLLEPGWLKKTGMIFVSGLQEHLFVERDWGIFPASRKMVLEAFRGKTQPIFFDNELLSQQLRQGKIKFSQVKISKTEAVFSYGFLWSAKLKLPQVISTAFLSEPLRQKSELTWEDPKNYWKNEAY